MAYLIECPDCLEEGKVVWFLRHQKTNEEDTGTNANVVTILCQTCGKNESIFLEDFLEEMFPDWTNKKAVNKAFEAFMNTNNGMVFSPESEGETLESTNEKIKES